MKIKNLITIMALAALLLPVKAQADDTADVPYRPLLEEGKTWWYSQGSLGKDGFGRDLYHEITVRGDTVMDGKKYMKLYIESIGKGGRYETTKYNHCIGLLREEDGRVYRESDFVEYPDDLLLYDFNMNVGDSSEYPFGLFIYSYPQPGVAGGSEIRRNNSGDPDHEEDAQDEESELDYFKMRYSVKDKYVTRQMEGDFVRMDIKVDNGSSYSVIEGVGTTTGYVLDPDFHYITSTICSEPPQLRWVTDKDGKVLYRESGVTKPWEISSVEYVPLVEEGKIWWYEAAVTDPETGQISKGSFGTTLAGDTVVNGKAYKKYMMLPVSKGGNPEKFVKDVSVPLALMREEERCQYMLFPDAENTELPVCAFSREDKDYYKWHGEYRTAVFSLSPSHIRHLSEEHYPDRVIERDGRKFVQKYMGGGSSPVPWNMTFVGLKTMERIT